MVLLGAADAVLGEQEEERKNGEEEHIEGQEVAQIKKKVNSRKRQLLAARALIETKKKEMDEKERELATLGRFVRALKLGIL